MKMNKLFQFCHYTMLSNISFTIFNMSEAATRIKLLTEKVSFPVYQEPASQVIMGLLGERKDDL